MHMTRTRSKEVTNPKGLLLSWDCSYVYCVIFDMSWFIFIIVETIGSGSREGAHGRPGLTDEQIREIITTKVVAAARRFMPECLGLSRLL